LTDETRVWPLDVLHGWQQCYIAALELSSAEEYVIDIVTSYSGLSVIMMPWL